MSQIKGIIPKKFVIEVYLKKPSYGRRFEYHHTIEEDDESKILYEFRELLKKYAENCVYRDLKYRVTLSMLKNHNYIDIRSIIIESKNLSITPDTDKS
jgi:hypothetical protein